MKNRNSKYVRYSRARDAGTDHLAASALVHLTRGQRGTYKIRYETRAPASPPQWGHREPRDILRLPGNQYIGRVVLEGYLAGELDPAEIAEAIHPYRPMGWTRETLAEYRRTHPEPCPWSDEEIRSVTEGKPCPENR